MFSVRIIIQGLFIIIIIHGYHHIIKDELSKRYYRRSVLKYILISALIICPMEHKFYDTGHVQDQMQKRRLYDSDSIELITKIVASTRPLPKPQY